MKYATTIPTGPHSRWPFLLPHRGFLCRSGPLARSPVGPIEGILDRLPCVEPHCLAGCDLDGLSALWISPLAGGPCRHIEGTEAGDTDCLSSHEGIENGVYYGLHRPLCCLLV